MFDYDDLLQQKITEVENGASVDDVINSLPEDAKGLEPLIRLATTVRTIPHPEEVPTAVAAQRQTVMSAAARRTSPLKASGLSWKWIGAGVTLAGAGTFAAICLLAIIGVSLWFSGRNSGTAHIEYITGQVQVATNRAGTEWKNIAVGYQLKRGDELRTLGASTATVSYFEGTHTFISPNTTLTYTELGGLSASAIQVKINETAGEIWNQVTPFQGNPKSYFLVQTPSGTASVHGTNFNVRVDATGNAQFSVNTGKVQVTNQSSSVTLLAGQATTASTSGQIEAASYQFNVSGTITDIDDTTNTMTVSGIPFQVPASAVIYGPKELGASVEVQGRILGDNTRVADSIEPVSSDDQNAFFTGTIESNSGDTWKIGSSQVKVDANTALSANLNVGKTVKVTFNPIDDNSWVATDIRNLADDTPNPTPTPSATVNPNAHPQLVFSPEEIEKKTCGSGDITFTANLKNTATNPADFASNVQLGYLIDEGGQYVSAVDLTPSSWTRIDAGQSELFTVHMMMNSQWPTAGGEDASVKMRITVTPASSEENNQALQVDIESECESTPTPGTPTVTTTVTETPTGTITGTVTVTPVPSATPLVTPTPAPTQVTQCTGVNPHPVGMRLAQRFGVPYAEIMKWFCQGYGFGEIDLAYDLAHASGKPVEEIFAMRASGMGWGEIRKALFPGVHGGGNGNGNGNGNGGGNKHKP